MFNLRDQYEKMETDELVDLSRRGTLTDIATNIIDEVIQERRERPLLSVLPTPIKAERLPIKEYLIINLWEGNLGLAMTYWVYGVLGGFVWGVGILALKPEGDLIKLVGLLFIIYYFVIYVGTWKAANKYVGSKVWAILAKFIIIIGVLPVAI